MREFYINLICTVVGMVFSFIFSYLAFRQRERSENRAEGKRDGVLISDVGYIKAGVDDLKKDNRETHRKLDDHNARITRCEESIKQAHKRIDEMGHGENGGVNR